MGAEDVRVWLRGGRLDSERLVDFVAALPGVERDPEQGLFIYRDEQAVIEIDIGPREHFYVKCCFAVCHPPSIEQAFVDFVLRIAKPFDAHIDLGADVPEGYATTFSPPLYEGFAESLSQATAEQWHYWKLMFGDAQAAVTTADAIRLFILPHCVKEKKDGGT